MIKSKEKVIIVCAQKAYNFLHIEMIKKLKKKKNQNYFSY